MSENNVEPVSMDSAKNVNPVVIDDENPEIERVDLDMDNGLLTLYFSEAVDRDTLDITEIYLQNAASESTQEYQLKEYKTLTWSLTHVDIYLSTDDVNQIKLLSGLATHNDTTFIRYSQEAVSDHTVNPVIPRNESEGLQVHLYTADTTEPELVSFILDFRGTPQVLSLTFNEPVQNDSVVFDSITLQSKENITDDAEYHVLTNGTVTTSNGLILSFELDFIDVVTIQSLRNLATVDTNTYISMLNGTVLDMANNPSVEISDEFANISAELKPDIENPTLSMFLFDADSGVVSLTFSESIDYKSFRVESHLVLLNDQDDFGEIPSIRLSNYSTVSEQDWYIINITLGQDDFNEIKIQDPYDFCSNAENCFVQIDSDFAVKDTSDRYLDRILPEKAVQAYDYVDDTTDPYLESFTFDIRSEEAILHLTFTEPVVLDSFDFSSMEFHNEHHINDSTTVIALTSGTPVTVTELIPVRGSVNTVVNTVQLDITLNQDDANLLKTYSNIGTSVEDTFLFLYSDTFKDYSDNMIDERSGFTVQASEVLPDQTHPYLDYFEFDLNVGQLKLVFSESMNASSLDFSAITIQSSSNSPLYDYTLTGGEGTPDNIRTINFTITVEDLNAIKKIRGLASRANNTYISFLSDGIVDMAGFNLTEIPPSEGKVTNHFSPDRTSPTLDSFTLNLTTEILSLTFDETVSYETLVFSQMAIKSPFGNTSVYLTDSSMAAENDSTVIDITLSTQDLNKIKLDTSIAVDLSTTQLVMNYGAIEDMAKQPSSYQILNASDFYPDRVSPQLKTFLFDLNSGLIILNFNEAINVDSVDETMITFLNAVNGSVLFSPKNLTINSTNGPQLRLILTSDDLNEIKKNTSLLSAMYNSYVNIYSGFITDMNNNTVEEILGVKARNVTEDSTTPLLEAFDFDLDSGTLTLYFSETVNASTFNAAGITLQSQLFAEETNRHRLSGGLLESVIDDTILTLVLADNDLNDIKALGIALFNDTTWLTMTNITVRDMSDNLASPISNSLYALGVDDYTEDENRPRVTNFTLDLTHEILVLTFSETVDVDTLNTTQITLLNSNDDYPSSRYTLSSLSYKSSPHGPVINITLDDYDLNEIKKLTNLGTSLTNTYLSVTSEAIEDRSGNPVVPVQGNTSVQAGSVVEDIHRPMLIEFSFDLNEGQMLLTFTETVNTTSISLTQFTLWSDNDTSEAIRYNLTGGSVLSMDGHEVLVEFTFFDLNEIKLLRALASGSSNKSNNTFLTVESSAVSDNEGNNLIGVYSPLSASKFISDVTRPELDDFNLDLDSGVLTLNFTEAVDGDTLTPQGITLLSLDTNTPDASVALYNATVISVEQSWIELNLTINDLNEIKALFDLATMKENTYISIDDATIYDTSNNPVVQLNLTDAVSVNILTPDRTSPVLISFVLDLNSGEMNLTYSETVVPDTLNSTAFTVQSAMSQALTDTCLYYTLQELDVEITGYDNTVVSVILNNIDLNEIKRRPDVATNVTNTFLSFTKHAINDTSMNPVVPREPSNAIQAADYIKDTTPPELAGFDFDLNNGQLTLRFTETVNRTTLTTDNLIFKADNTSNATNYTITGEDSSFVP